MEYKNLGRTGISVSRFCLGTMMFGSWSITDEKECIRIIHAALDGGINFIDTSDVYSYGESETILGKALKGRRDDVVITTKFNNPWGDNPLHRGGSRRWIMQAVEGSLRRLQTDYIDVFMQHSLDLNTDMDETLGALSDLVRQGKVRVIGSSNHPVETIVEAQWLAERRNHVPVRCHQGPYSILARFNERDLLPTCQKYGMGVMLWSPLSGGWLGGAIRRGQPLPKVASFRAPQRFDLNRPQNQAKLDVVEELAKLAADAGITMAQLALAFVKEHPAVTAPIVGPGSMKDLEDVLADTDVRLSTEVLDRIDELVTPGTNVDEIDRGWQSPSLNVEARRGGNASSKASWWRPAYEGGKRTEK
jgi:aryl-alcohol dehydrogenase-like predicted oxidoreductase